MSRVESPGSGGGPAATTRARSPRVRREFAVHCGGVDLPATVIVPADAAGLVAFAHGSGSSRFSRRNLHVAQMLHEAGLATLLFDLLTPEEELDRRNVFDVGLLAGRLVAATQRVGTDPDLRHLPVGYFGASTGAAAALEAANEANVEAIVSRGGQPDLAAAQLPAVRAPTLLIVGDADPVVLELNRRVLGLLPRGSRLVVVEGASHLFEEPGALDDVGRLARDWFVRHLDADRGLR